MEVYKSNTKSNWKADKIDATTAESIIVGNNFLFTEKYNYWKKSYDVNISDFLLSIYS